MSNADIWLLLFSALAVGGVIGHIIGSYLFRETTLRDDSPTDSDSSSADRRDTF